MPVVRRALLALGLVVAVVIVASATFAVVRFVVPAATPGEGVRSASVDAQSGSAADAPRSFLDRPPYASCGHVVLGADDPIPAARIACLAEAGDEGRELVVESSTAEGDPVVRYYRAGPGIRGVLIFEDATADPTDGRWHRVACASGRIDQTGACA